MSGEPKRVERGGKGNRRAALRARRRSPARSHVGWKWLNSTQAERSKVYERIRGVRRKADLEDSYGALSETARSRSRAYAKARNSACASAISGISVVGAKPSSACARTALASVRRAVD
jgi:hypothetical protein